MAVYESEIYQESCTPSKRIFCPSRKWLHSDTSTTNSKQQVKTSSYRKRVNMHIVCNYRKIPSVGQKKKDEKQQEMGKNKQETRAGDRSPALISPTDYPGVAMSKTSSVTLSLTTPFLPSCASTFLALTRSNKKETAIPPLAPVRIQLPTLTPSEKVGKRNIKCGKERNNHPSFMPRNPIEPSC